MIYFSELKGRKVYSEDQIEIGVLEDMIFLAAESSQITKIVVRAFHGDKLIIPISYFKRFSNPIIVGKDYNTSKLQDNELFILKNLLDKQIIDLTGNKLVRVNDVAINEKEPLSVMGVDISILAIFRWLGLENFLIKLHKLMRINLTAGILSWTEVQPLELTHGRVKLKTREQRLQKIRPEDLAVYLEKTNIRNIGKILNTLEDQYVAKVIGNLNLNYQNALFRQFPVERTAKVLSIIAPDESTDILLSLSAIRREQIIANLSVEKKKEIMKLINLSKTDIGKLITTEFMTVSPGDDVHTIIERIKKETIGYFYFNVIYVVNEKKQLIGVFNLHELLQQNLDNQVYKFMAQNVVSLYLTTPIETAIKKMYKYRLHSLPVINKNSQVVGIITTDDLTRTLFLDKIYG